MGFFTRDEAKKDDPSKRDDSQRVTGKIDAKAVAVVPAAAKRSFSLKTFVLGFRPSEKLQTLPAERFEEAIKGALPKGTRVTHVSGPMALARDNSIHYFEIVLPDREMPEALGAILEKGLLDGQLQVALSECVVMCDASGKNSQISMMAEVIPGAGTRFTIRTDSPEVYVQYPPVDVHRRWLADDDYRAAYGRWRTERSDDVKPAKWHSGWAAGGTDDAGPPWIRLKARDGNPSEYYLEFDDNISLRFAFQGAVISIQRFNLKVLANRLTGELAVYRSLPLSLESMPKEVQDRMNREPERFKPVREPGRFGANYDLVRTAYEELGGDYFKTELPAPQPGNAPTPAPMPRAVYAPPTPAPEAPPSQPVSKDSISLQSGPYIRPEDSSKKKMTGMLSAPKLGGPLVTPPVGTLRGVKPGEAPKAEEPKAEA
jgi:hypothetical protein